MGYCHRTMSTSKKGSSSPYQKHGNMVSLVVDTGVKIIMVFPKLRHVQGHGCNF